MLCVEVWREQTSTAMAVSIAQPSLLEPDNLDAPYPDRAPEAVLQDADRLTIHSGNIASWNKLRRRAVLTTTDEVRLQTSRLNSRAKRGHFYRLIAAGTGDRGGFEELAW